MRIALILGLLAACAWAVGNLLVGALVAPAVFAQAATADGGAGLYPRTTAGVVVGAILDRWCLVPATILALATASGLLACCWDRRRWLGAIAAGMVLAVHGGSLLVLGEARDSAARRRVDPTAVDDATFARQHRASTAWFLAETGAALGAMAVLAVRLARRDGVRDAGSAPRSGVPSAPSGAP